MRFSINIYINVKEMIKFGCNEIDKKSKLQSHREIINLMKKRKKKIHYQKNWQIMLSFSTIIT